LSVVVYHKGVMAADSRAYSGSTHPIGTKLKIHRLADGSIVGITSNQVGMPEAFVEWLNKGANRDDVMPAEPCLSAIHVSPTGEVAIYSDGYTPSRVMGETFTVGSGRKYALGAIAMGADAVRAVEVAIENDLWCGGPVALLHLAGKSPPLMLKEEPYAA